ncbi:MAG: hypothetical protein PHV20_10560 [Bacteroidales bacterium]|nr:hypothetical protein [Bacteroidales bacterium]
MKTMRLHFVLLMIVVNCVQLIAKNIQPVNLTDSLIEFLITKDDFDESMKAEGTMLIVNDVLTLKQYKNQEAGIFKFGTLTSHSYFHLLLKEKDNETLVDMKQPYENIVFLLLEYFQRNEIYSKDKILLYIKKVTELYNKNRSNNPWKVDK